MELRSPAIENAIDVLAHQAVDDLAVDDPGSERKLSLRHAPAPGHVQAPDDLVDHLLRVDLAERRLAVDADRQLRPRIGEGARVVRGAAAHRELALRGDGERLRIALVHGEANELHRRVGGRVGGAAAAPAARSRARVPAWSPRISRIDFGDMMNYLLAWMAVMAGGPTRRDCSRRSRLRQEAAGQPREGPRKHSKVAITGHPAGVSHGDRRPLGVEGPVRASDAPLLTTSGQPREGPGPI